MFTNRLVSISVGLLVVSAAVVLGLLILSVFAGPDSAVNANAPYTQSIEQAEREYLLGERYGETPQTAASLTAEAVQREYILGERYGVTPKDYAREKALREFWLGERYGQLP